MAEGAVGDALIARELAEHFEFDRVDWCHLLWQADQLGRRQDFRRLVVRIAAELERVEVLHADQIRALMEPEAVDAESDRAGAQGGRGSSADHKRLGRIRRHRRHLRRRPGDDRIRFGAFANTIARWQQSGKRVPLHWDHRGEASNVIGSVDPATMQEKASLGLYVEGKLDLDDSQVAREAWRSMRDDRVSLSFGYLTVNSHQREDITDLLELDLFEISIVPSPANPQTRILEMKSVAAVEREQRDLRRRCDELALEAALGWQPIPTFVEPGGRTDRRRPATSFRRTGSPHAASHRRQGRDRGSGPEPDAGPAHAQRRTGSGAMRGKGRSTTQPTASAYRRVGRRRESD